MKRSFTLALAGVFILALALSLSACSTSTEGDSATEPTTQAQGTPIELTIKDGPIKGETVDGISVYKGIPYAAPTAGDNRFAPPQDVKLWTEVRDCTEFGDAAPQTTVPEGSPAMSEDCLSLNVWTSEGADTAAKLPVYVWIHGGAFAFGSSSEPDYDGTNYANEGIVYVSINYRINAMGFYSSQETYDTYGTTGNWGLLDQIKALEWVQANIEKFGGDPTQVTVGGESAGSYSTSALIMSPLAKGLFNQAIMQSGTVLGVPGNVNYTRGDLTRAIDQNIPFSKAFDITTDDAAGLKKIREVDSNLLVSQSAISLDFAKTAPYMMMPVYDGHVLPHDPVKALNNGEVNKVNVLMGWNKDEGSVFIPEATDATYSYVAARTYGLERSLRSMEQMPVDKDNDALERTRQTIAYGMFTAGMPVVADAVTNAGNTAYVYNFNYVTTANQESGLGARHGSEIPLESKNFGESDSQADKDYAPELYTRWVNFIKNGDPNKGDAAPTYTEWPVWTIKDKNVILFEQDTVKAGEMGDRENMDFMANLLYGSNPYYR